MILVCGVLADGMTELMCARLTDLRYDYLLLDQASYPGRYDVTWEIGATGVRGNIREGDRVVDLMDLTGVYARYVAYTGGRERPDLSKRENELVDGEYQLSLMQLLDVLPCAVVNRAKASTSNDSKIYQGFVAASFGFRTPRTLVTTDPDEVRAFYEACGHRVIYKSLSGVRSIVRRLRDEDMDERLQRVRACPTQFQEWIDGVDIRVHTVGDTIYATEIVSAADDYRYAGRQGTSLVAREIDPPPQVAAACTGMAHALGLLVAGVDLRRTPGGEYYCFEVNPSPGFLFYERQTGQPISTAVARLLRDGNGTHMRV